MQHLLPLSILVPYCAYVISTTFEDHNEQRAENDRKRLDPRSDNITAALDDMKKREAKK